jgi:hypothetical protein
MRLHLLLYLIQSSIHLNHRMIRYETIHGRRHRTQGPLRPVLWDYRVVIRMASESCYSCSVLRRKSTQMITYDPPRRQYLPQYRGYGKDKDRCRADFYYGKLSQYTSGWIVLRYRFRLSFDGRTLHSKTLQNARPATAGRFMVMNEQRYSRRNEGGDLISLRNSENTRPRCYTTQILNRVEDFGLS